MNSHIFPCPASASYCVRDIYVSSKNEPDCWKHHWSSITLSPLHGQYAVQWLLPTGAAGHHFCVYQHCACAETDCSWRLDFVLHYWSTTSSAAAATALSCYVNCSNSWPQNLRGCWHIHDGTRTKDCLLCCATSAPKHLLISFRFCSSVIDPVVAGLWQCHTVWHSIIPASVASQWWTLLPSWCSRRSCHLPTNCFGWRQLAVHSIPR